MIILTKYKIWHKDNYDHKKEIEEVNSVIPFLNEVIKIERKVTLGDIFNHIERDKELFDIVFSSHLGHNPIQLYIDDINKECPKDDEEDLYYIELKWFYEHSEYDKYESEINIFVDVSAIGDFEDKEGFYEEGEEKPKKTEYAIEFIQLRKMKNLPVKINKQLDIYKKNRSGPGKNNEDLVATGEKYFSVYDFFGELLYELSFVGPPEKRNEFSCEIDDISEKMYGEGLKNFHSFKDLKKELEKKNKKKNDKKDV